MISAHSQDATEASTGRPIDELVAHVRLLVSGRVRGLQVVAANRGLVLRGRARTYYVKQIAQHAVMGATDLPIPANEIEVA